jgi:hypothetical protein
LVATGDIALLEVQGILNHAWNIDKPKETFCREQIKTVQIYPIPEGLKNETGKVATGNKEDETRGRNFPDFHEPVDFNKLI